MRLLVALLMLVPSIAFSAASTTLSLTSDAPYWAGDGPGFIRCQEFTADSVAAGDTIYTPALRNLGGIVVSCFMGSVDSTVTPDIYTDSLGVIGCQFSPDNGSNWTSATVNSINVTAGYIAPYRIRQINPNDGVAARGTSLLRSPSDSAPGGYRIISLLGTTAESAGTDGGILPTQVPAFRFAAIVHTRPRAPSSTGSAALYRPVWRVYTIWQFGRPGPNTKF